MVKLKPLSLLLVSIFIVSPAISQDFERVPEEQVNQVQTDLAKSFAHHFFSALKDGKSYEFQEDVTELLSQSLPPEKQKLLYQYITEQFGNYQSLEYVETYKYSGDEDTIILRFKGIFDMNKVIPDIRVVLDKDNKIAGFWMKPWTDELK